MDDQFDSFDEMQLGDLLVARRETYAEKKQIETGPLAEKKETLAVMDRVIVRKMQDLGLRQLQDESGKATFHVTDEIVPKITDFDALYPYIAKNGYWQLLYRKVTASAWREIIQSGEEVPGTEPETVTRLRMRSN
jgi:hypothetical protein